MRQTWWKGTYLAALLSIPYMMISDYCCIIMHFFQANPFFIHPIYENIDIHLTCDSATVYNKETPVFPVPGLGG